MKYTSLCLLSFSFLLLLFGCSQPKKIILTGTIGKKLASEFVLRQSGDKFSGYFTYLQSDSKKIEVQGVKINQTLRIEEFNNSDNRVTGIFEGIFDGNCYKGYWQNPNLTKKIAFSYWIKKEKQQISNSKDYKIKIHECYSNWVKEEAKGYEFWDMATREKYHEENWKDGKNKNYQENCRDGLPDYFENAQYADINQDGFMDAWATVTPFYCTSGTIVTRFGPIKLVFLSSFEGVYRLLNYEESAIINRNIGNFGSLDTIYSNGIMKFSGLEHGEYDANCCPSKKWKVSFAYKNGKFEIISGGRK